MKKKIRIIAITTGDFDGVGLEVTVKAMNALSAINLRNHFLIIRSNKADSKQIHQLSKLNTVKTNSILKTLNLINSGTITQPTIFDIQLSSNPALWVEEVAVLCLEKKIQALVTGPLSKETIIQSGLKDMGHTGILQRISKSKFVFMCFLGKYFNVLCLTGHIPISKVENQISKKKVQAAIKFTQQLTSLLPQKFRNKPIGILGLNPHASENGLIGNFDSSRLVRWFKPNHSIQGPLVPDVAFQKQFWDKYALYISLYHDQGLIPFKLVHGQNSGAHLTLGIPFVRTSVDHGTAKDIYKKNIANHQSMLDAIKWALKLSRSEKTHELR